jgi:hypothetical protein
MISIPDPLDFIDVDLVAGAVIELGGFRAFVDGDPLGVLQRTVRLHPTQGAIPPQVRRRQSLLRHCSNWSGVAVATTTFTEVSHARTEIPNSPPPPTSRSSPAKLIPSLWERLSPGQRQHLARLVGQLLARHLRPINRQEVRHEAQ